MLISLIKNPDDATLAPLNALSNMQIRTAITEFPFFGPSSLKVLDIEKDENGVYTIHIVSKVSLSEILLDYLAHARRITV